VVCESIIQLQNLVVTGYTGGHPSDCTMNDELFDTATVETRLSGLFGTRRNSQNNRGSR